MTASIYEQAGSDAAFQRLVDEFYARVEADPLLRPLFPAELGPGKERQFLFLTQYFGGPRRYEELRGHPRLRMRHAPFPISPREAARWLAHMLAAIEAAAIADPAAEALRDYFRQAAPAMVNRGVGVAADGGRLDVARPGERAQ